jgi:hypothetical protein
MDLGGERGREASDPSLAEAGDSKSADYPLAQECGPAKARSPVPASVDLRCWLLAVCCLLLALGSWLLAVAAALLRAGARALPGPLGSGGRRSISTQCRRQGCRRGFRRCRDAPSENPDRLTRTRSARKRGGRGRAALSLAYFSLGTQREVTRAGRRTDRKLLIFALASVLRSARAEPCRRRIEIRPTPLGRYGGAKTTPRMRTGRDRRHRKVHGIASRTRLVLQLACSRA